MDFKQDVLMKSEEQAVVVDFWAPWCAPCRALGPVIEQIAKEQDGKWTLVKLNTEEEQTLAEQYGIRSIPNVKMFYKGEVIAEFSGALPRNQILTWLEEHLPDDTKEEIAQLLKELEESNNTETIEKLKTILAKFPERTDAAIGLAKHIIFTDPTLALALTKGISLSHKLYDQANDVQQLGLLLTSKNDDSPAGQSVEKAKVAAQSNDLEATAQHLIAAVTADRSYQKELTRKSAIALFRTLGHQHPVTKNYRWRFDMALY
jgi:putative thioredoxin